mgnify:CR=1 FL=1
MFPQHVYFYTPATLAALLRREGFVPLATTTWDPWHGPGTVSASLVNQARRMTGGGLPSKAWSQFMIAAHQGLAPAPLFGLGTAIAPVWIRKG